MSRLTTILLVCGLVLLSSCSNSSSRKLFDGANLEDWQTSGNVLVRDSSLILSGFNSRAALKNSAYKNLDLHLRARTTSGGTGYIAFHTDDSEKGYRVAINNDNDAPIWWKKTGSLLSVRNLTKSFVKEGQWFDMDIRVEGQAITVKVNGEPVVEYIEPEHPYRVSPNEKALLSEGTIELISNGQGDVEFKDIFIETIDERGIDTAAQFAQAGDEQTDEIIRLHQEDFPVLDYHVHLKGGLTKEVAAAQSRRLGINYVVAPNCGIGFPITDDEGVYCFLDSMRTQPFILAMQGEGREWPTTFSEAARKEFDFVFTDALTFTDRKGRRVRLWIDDEVFIDNEQEYMDLIVEKMCDVFKEPADIYVNPFFLPTQMNDRYDMFWTDQRVNKVIAALKQSGKALEINELYQIPSKAIIMKAKEAGLKFSFGTNNVKPEVGKLEYAIRMKKECGLKAQDMYKPKIKL
ncbi:MAG: DUF1080 domain-containing protein [Bacteroides sp.]|nr:DUF1080 domain-containing protein [Bacteroides sp.]